MRFTNLTVHQWRQFDDVDINFHPRVTVLTGANGAGKSTLLRILSQHFGWSNNLLGSPRRASDGSVSYLYRRSGAENEHSTQVGSISYSNGVTARMHIPHGGSATYNIGIDQQQGVEGLFIGSHRPMPSYQPVTNIPTAGISAQQAYQQYWSEVMQRFNNGYTQFSPVYRMKEAIISMATFGPGNKNVEGNQQLQSTFEEFEYTLRLVLPPSIGFQKLVVRLPDVVLITSSGEFLVDASSGGIMSLIDLAWQVFLYSRGKDFYTVVLDEPENHLHPSMQRTIINSLSSAFINAQFVVATHSPFIVSSVRESYVYVLKNDNEKYPGARSITSVLLDKFSRAGTASDILRDALGVPVTMPMWAEDELRAITRDFSINSLDDEGVAALRARLDEVGLADLYPEALAQIARKA